MIEEIPGLEVSQAEIIERGSCSFTRDFFKTREPMDLLAGIREIRSQMAENWKDFLDALKPIASAQRIFKRATWQQVPFEVDDMVFCFIVMGAELMGDKQSLVVPTVSKFRGLGLLNPDFWNTGQMELCQSFCAGYMEAGAIARERFAIAPILALPKLRARSKPIPVAGKV